MLSERHRCIQFTRWLNLIFIVMIFIFGLCLFWTTSAMYLRTEYQECMFSQNPRNHVKIIVQECNPFNFHYIIAHTRKIVEVFIVNSLIAVVVLV